MIKKCLERGDSEINIDDKDAAKLQRSTARLLNQNWKTKSDRGGPGMIAVCGTKANNVYLSWPVVYGAHVALFGGTL